MVSKRVENLKLFFLVAGFLLASWCVKFLSGDNHWISENWQIMLRGFAYFFLFWLIFSRSAWRLSLFWMGFPILLFLMLWLKIYWALLFSIIALIALRDAWRFDWASERQLSFGSFMPAALLVLVWVSLSGVGGYGAQVSDYSMHNARLSDLVNFSWPVVYEKIALEGGMQTDSPMIMVAYSAYYLPAALIGKLYGFAAAQEFMHYWTLAGCWLALRWLVLLSEVVSPLLAAFALVFFSGWGFFGASLVCSYASDPIYSFFECGRMIFSVMKESIYTGISQGTGIDSPVFLDNWSFAVFDPGYWFGGYFSLATSLYWAPHHVVVSWIAIALLMRFFITEQYRYVGLIMGMLTFWSPFMSFALLPLSIFMLLISARKHIASWLSFPNFTGMILANLMLIYYSSAAESGNSFEILTFKNYSEIYWFFVFHAFSWLLCALVIFFTLLNESIRVRVFLVAVCFCLFAFSLIHYGLYNDLAIRSAVPFFFCMAVFLLRAFSAEWANGSRIRAIFLILLLLPGSFSALYDMVNGYAKRDVRVPVQSIATHQYGGLFLGSMDSFYARFFSGHDDGLQKYR